MSNNSEILTSTGSLGLKSRSDDRYYLNWPKGAISDLNILERLSVLAQKALINEKASRCVGRFILTSDSFADLAENNSLNRFIEGQVPVYDHNGNIPWRMVLFAINNADRSPLFPVETIVQNTQNPIFINREPKRSLTDDRIYPINQFDLKWTRQILDLWGHTFGWVEPEIINLHSRLDSQAGLNPEDRYVWFTGLVKGDEILSLSMAERLDMPITEGLSVPIIESTEWNTLKSYRNKGLMGQTISNLHKQIIEDTQRLSIPPVIIAETNYLSGSYHVGWRVGMRIPDRQIGKLTIPQVLSQNVTVKDGLEPNGRRDFLLMHLPFSEMKGVL